MSNSNLAVIALFVGLNLCLFVKLIKPKNFSPALFLILVISSTLVTTATILHLDSKDFLNSKNNDPTVIITIGYLLFFAPYFFRFSITEIGQEKTFLGTKCMISIEIIIATISFVYLLYSFSSSEFKNLVDVFLKISLICN